MKMTRRFLVSSLVLALTACSDVEAPPAAVQADPVPADRIAALSRELAAAEALRSVKRLQWAYGHYSEFGLWHDFADLFADTGVGHYVQGDLDREGIRALFVDQVGQGQLGLADGRIYPHISFSPVVTLAADGEHANARFRILAMLGGYGGNATWFHGLYENAYVKERGVWKLNELSNAAQVTGNFTAGLSASASAPFAQHYTTEQVGSIVTAPAQAADALPSLLQRAQLLADEQALIGLQHQFGYYLDSHDWDEFVELFADNASFESGQQGVYLGKASIRNALNQFGELAEGEVDEHILFQPYVSIAPDGQRAAIRIDQLGLQGSEGGSAQWTQGIYENTFIKQDGRWLIESVHYYPRLITDYLKGWAADAQPAPGPSATYPPDAPPTETYETYPAFYLPAFHFNHPVTGRAPQYPQSSPANGKPAAFPGVPVDLALAADDTNALRSAEALTQQARAYDAVENLVNAYAYYVDECRLEQAAALFADVAEIEFMAEGSAPRNDIARALEEQFCPAEREEGALTLHHAVQPVIALSDEGSAAFMSKLWQVAASPGRDSYRTVMLLGEASLQAGQWKLTALTTTEGWPLSRPSGELLAPGTP